MARLKNIKSVIVDYYKIGYFRVTYELATGGGGKYFHFKQNQSPEMVIKWYQVMEYIANELTLNLKIVSYSDDFINYIQSIHKNPFNICYLYKGGHGVWYLHKYADTVSFQTVLNRGNGLELNFIFPVADNFFKSPSIGLCLWEDYQKFLK